MRSHPIGTGQATKSDEFSEGGSFSIQKFILQILDLYKGFFSGLFPKIYLQYSFSKMTVEGQRLFGIFPKIRPIW